MGRLEKLLLFAALFLIFSIATAEIHSFDVFWQLQSGRYIVQTKSFIYQDIFTLAAEAPRFEHCWLHDVILYLAYLIGGYTSLSVLKGLVLGGTALVLVAAAWVRGAAWPSILLLLTPFLLSRGGWLARPQIWTFLLFAVFVLILERHRKSGGREIFLLFPLMILWVNLHAGAILAVPILVAYLVGEGGSLAIKWSTLPAGAYKKIWIAGGLVLLAFLFTPYTGEFFDTLFSAHKLGAGGVDAAGRSLTPITQMFNMDWRPTTFANDPYFYYAMAVAGVLMLLGWRRLSLTDLCLMGGLALMGLKLSRHTSFFFLGMVAILPIYADAVAEGLTARFQNRFRQILRGIATIGAAAIFVYFALPAYETYGLFRTGLRSWHYPMEAAEFVREHQLPPNMYNTYDWGGYLAWILYPEYQVFWDGRQDSPEMFNYGWRIMSGHPGWEGVLDKFGVKTIVSKACTVDSGQHYPLLDQLRESSQWALVFADESSLVFVRRDAVEENWLVQNRLPDERIDDTILSEARLLVQTEPQRYKGWWEIARIQMARRQYPEALFALENYLVRTPTRDPLAENYYRTIYPMVKGGRLP